MSLERIPISVQKKSIIICDWQRDTKRPTFLECFGTSEPNCKISQKVQTEGKENVGLSCKSNR